jgi:hypothetical protein
MVAALAHHVETRGDRHGRTVTAHLTPRAGRSMIRDRRGGTGTGPALGPASGAVSGPVPGAVPTATASPSASGVAHSLWTIARIQHALTHPVMERRFLTDLAHAPEHEVMNVFAAWRDVAATIEHRATTTPAPTAPALPDTPIQEGQ